MATSQRDHRNFVKGYQEALTDILDAMDRGSEAEVIEWIKNNGNETTRARLQEVVNG